MLIIKKKLDQKPYKGVVAGSRGVVIGYNKMLSDQLVGFEAYRSWLALKTMGSSLVSMVKAGINKLRDGKSVMLALAVEQGLITSSQARELMQCRFGFKKKLKETIALNIMKEMGVDVKNLQSMDPTQRSMILKAVSLEADKRFDDLKLKYEAVMLKKIFRIKDFDLDKNPSEMSTREAYVYVNRMISRIITDTIAEGIEKRLPRREIMAEVERRIEKFFHDNPDLYSKYKVELMKLAMDRNNFFGSLGEACRNFFLKYTVGMQRALAKALSLVPMFGTALAGFAELGVVVSEGATEIANSTKKDHGPDFFANMFNNIMNKKE